MAQCEMTLKAIGGALNTEILFVCKALHLVESEKDYYICVGENCFYFIDEFFDKVRGKSEYNNLLRIIVDQKIETILQIHFKESKDQNMPLKMNLICYDRKNLIYYLNYAWKTYQMYYSLEVKDLPIYQQDIKFQNKANKKTIGPPEFMFQQKDDGVKFTINNYVFQLNAQFKNIQTGIYEYKAAPLDYQLFIQVTNPLPLHTIQKMGVYSYLDQYALKYIDQIVAEYGIQKYYIEYSNPYIRRHNLTEDKSQWKGWEISIVTNQSKIRQVNVIILRRSFLPPLLENFNDIIIVLFSNSAAYNKKGKIEARQIADSIYPFNMVLPIYSLLIQDKCNSLSLQEINYEFLLSHDPPLYPNAIYYSFLVIKYIHNKLSNSVSQQKRLKIKEDQIISRMTRLHVFNASDNLNKFKSLQFNSIQQLILYIQDEIAKQFDFQDQDNQNILEQQDQVIEDFRQNRNNVSGNFDVERNSVNMLSKQMQKFSFDSYNWKKKVSRFITFCVDGGIFGDRFSLVDVIEGISDSQCKRDCQDLLEYCLFMFSEDGQLNYTGITKSVEKSIQNLNNFNERVMIQLIKNHYFYNYYVEQDVSQSNIYQQLMIYFLMEHNSIELKKAVCYHIIDKLNKKSEDQAIPSQAGQILNELVAPLIYLYSKSDDTNLQLYSCITLQNILVQVSDSKQTMIQNNCIEIIYSKLESSNQKMVNYSLKFIYNLFDGMNTSQIFNMSVLQDKILQIIKGYKGMKDYRYNIEVMCTALSLIRKLLNSNENEFIKIRDSADLFHKIMLPSLNRQQDDYFCDQELQEETLGIFVQLANVDQTIKDKIAKRNGEYHSILAYSIDLILNLVNGLLLDRSLSLIITLCQDRNDLISYLKQNQLFYSAIKFLRFDSKPPINPNTPLAKKLEACLWLFSNNVAAEEEASNDKSKKKK
ncbi:hypothetical protein TTHERM_00938850 (macronuclear) [Tetrahymena thermophila SB210]|uniref:Armadillo-type fold n=1 Tax=Tetrahymena thermophila (strain SB210) TaxID=312017 RepID=Q22DQ7_TETTS|nr:hypothetical protein TTHERM_00938850 [Tetrahymena thermophila SB210]EAR83397.2 hypothetical protein TTHERM_00938850 [Tetrahymena thermophila SB210]|eukprot:XP_001031060.2 hypothetical protein TTHERM_00938850 [Tetrahymena thermophila SB210]